jgi:hypothetical protein
MEERKAMMELITNENRPVMDPSTMNAFTREWWNMRTEEIMLRRRQKRLHRGGAGLGGGYGGGADEGHGGGHDNVFFA